MILVCPSCDSKFKVPDNAIPPEGRKVRCANCGNAWHATKADELKPAPKPAARAAAPARATRPQPAAPAMDYTPPAQEVDAGTAAQAAALRRAVVEEEEETPVADTHENPFDEGLGDGASEYAPGDDESSFRSSIDEVSQQDDSFGETPEFDGENEYAIDDASGEYDEDDLEAYDEDDILARRRGDLRRAAQRRSAAIKRKVLTAGWALLLIFIFGVLGALFFMKETVVNTFPGTIQLYEYFADKQANARFQPETDEPLTPPITETEVYVKAGLFEDKLRYEEEGGQYYLVIEGELENTGSRAASVPKVELSILDSRRRVLDQWVYDPPGLVLRRGSTLKFATRRLAPAGAQSVEVKPLEGTRSDNRAPSRL